MTTKLLHKVAKIISCIRIVVHSRDDEGVGVDHKMTMGMVITSFQIDLNCFQKVAMEFFKKLFNG